MSAVLSKFNLPVTDEQKKRIRSEWEAHGVTGSAIICQPVGINNVYSSQDPALNFAILTPACSQEILAVLRKHSAP